MELVDFIQPGGNQGLASNFICGLRALACSGRHGCQGHGGGAGHHGARDGAEKGTSGQHDPLIWNAEKRRFAGGAPQSRGDTHMFWFVVLGAQLERVVRATHEVAPSRGQKLRENGGIDDPSAGLPAPVAARIGSMTPFTGSGALPCSACSASPGRRRHACRTDGTTNPMARRHHGRLSRPGDRAVGEHPTRQGQDAAGLAAQPADCGQPF